MHNKQRQKNRFNRLRITTLPSSNEGLAPTLVFSPQTRQKHSMRRKDKKDERQTPKSTAIHTSVQGWARFAFAAALTGCFVPLYYNA